jgi:hypothetical protein
VELTPALTKDNIDRDSSSVEVIFWEVSQLMPEVELDPTPEDISKALTASVVLTTVKSC